MRRRQRQFIPLLGQIGQMGMNPNWNGNIGNLNKDNNRFQNGINPLMFQNARLNFEQMQVRQQEQAQNREQAKKIGSSVTMDPVTGLPNRVRFMDDLTRAIAAATRYDEPLSLIVLDLVDADADEQAAGEGLLRLVRITDVVARISPGRFAIILPRTGTVGCALVAARVAAPDENTFTLGSATFAGESTEAAALLARAEAALDGQPS